MHQYFPVFNFSLKKLLSSESDSFERARMKILYVILTFSLLKVLITMMATWHSEQYPQFDRACVMLVIYFVLFKMLLTSRRFVHIVSHGMAWLALLLIWSSVFVYAQTVNTLTVQFVFMLILGCFYLLQLRFALIYSCLAFLPLILLMLLPGGLFIGLIPASRLASPGYEMMLILNFVTIIISHYLFRRAFMDNLMEKEALNNQLRLAVNEANRAAESKSDFLSTMSHELRTPLNSVIGVTELLLHDDHSKEQEENLNILKFSAGNLHALINDILDFNKLGSGKLDLEAIPVDLNRLMEDISQGLRFQATQKKIDFVLEVDDRLKDLSVITDPTRISQIIYNLAGNAIKFTEVGRVILRLKLLHNQDANIRVRISVKDSGIGISPDKQEAIFEPFTQENTSITRNFGGTGLGLAIVKRLLFLFNSVVHLDSTPNIGSTFSFELVLEKNKVLKSVLSDKASREYDLAGLKILIAEDNSMNRILLTKVLSKWNCSFTFALNGQEAVEKVINQDFDLILMDLHMPVMDGYKASAAIRGLDNPIRSAIPIIALTASVSSNLSEKIKLCGMDDFVLKPFKLDDLFDKLKLESFKVS